MAKSKEPIVVKKYSNRRLYHGGTYLTLKDLAGMVKSDKDFIVSDAETGEDITRWVLTQIVLEQANKGRQNLLPITLLRQLIRFYGDSKRMLVPRYLKVSIEAPIRKREKFRRQLRADRIKRRDRKSSKGG
jgi:polyhydroxyalkanoate synthesis repressor PhaR